MPQQNIVVMQDSAKSVNELFAELADHNRLQRVFGVPVRRVCDGRDDVNGVGSVRQLGPAGPLAIEETVTAFEPGRSIHYRITKGGFPVRNHSGELAFAQNGNGSRVTWTIGFDAALPLAGPLLRRVLEGAIRKGLKRIAAGGPRRL